VAKPIVKRNGKRNDKRLVGWQEALADAEQKIRNSEKELGDWKAVAAICRRNIAGRVPWPENAATQN
jgi:hypothetical protein